VVGALNVPVTELTPGPLVREPAGEHPAVRAVRLALSRQDVIALLFQGRRRPRGDRPELSELKARA